MLKVWQIFRQKGGEDTFFCLYLIFVIKKMRTKIHFTNTHNIEIK